MPNIVEQYPNPPVELPADYDLVQQKIQDIYLD